MSKDVLIHIQTKNEEIKELISSELFCIGRSDRADVTIKNSLLSRKHIQVKVQNSKIFIKDLDTTNGTLVDEESLSKSEWCEINSGSTIKVGHSDENIVFIFSLTQEAPGDEISEVDSHQEFEQNIEEEETAVVNLADFSEKLDKTDKHYFSSAKTPAESMQSANDNKSSHRERRRNRKSKSIGAARSYSEGATAIKLHDDEPDSFSPVVEGNVRDILTKVDNSEDTEFSEIELLEIKKIEIESQVKALKIKEESELEAKRLIEKALGDAETIVIKARGEAEDYKESALLEADDIYEDAKEEACEIVEQAKDEASELLSNVEKKLSRIQSEVDGLESDRSELRIKLDGLHEKVTESLEQKKSYEIQSDRLKTAIEEEEARVKQLILDHEEKSISFKTELKDVEEELHNLYIERDEAVSKLDHQNRECLEVKNQKEILEANVLGLKEKEANLATTIEKSEERIDKIYIEKDKLIEENKNLEERSQELSRELSDLDEKLDKINNLILEKEDYLRNIEQKAENYFLSQKEKCDSEIQKRISDEDKRFKSLLSQNENTAKSILESAQQKAEKLEFEASELFRIAEDKEREIAELEESSNVEFENQRKKLNEQLLKKLHDGNNEAKEIRNNALAEYEEVLTSAKEKAQKILEDANANSEDKIEKAKEDAKEIFLASKEELVKAQEKATEVINYAQDKSAQIHQEGLKELEELKVKLSEENTEIKTQTEELIQKKTDLNDEIEETKKSIDAQKAQFKENMHAKREEILSQAKVEAQEIVNQANTKLDKAEENVRLMHEAKLQETDDMIKSKQDAEKKRVEAQIHKEKELLAKLRAQEMENLKVKREKEEAELKNRKDQYVDSIVKGIENLVNTKLKEYANTKGKKDTPEVELEKISYLVKASLLDKNPENNELLKKLNPYGKAGKGKSTKLMRRIVIAGAIMLGLLMINVISPGFYSSIGDSVSSAFSVDESAKDLYLKGLQEKRDNKPKFDPKQTDTFKKSYTDNILYTKRFVELWPSDELQKDWTIKVDEIIVYKLKLKDYKVVKYISEEFKLIRNLITMSKKIKLKTEKEQIQEMREFEAKYRKRLIDIMSGKKNLKQMHFEQKKFFIKYKQKHPASTSKE